MTVTVKVEGFRELDNALGALTKATARNVIKRALVKAGQPIADGARRLAPVDKGDLRPGIAVSTKITRTAFNAAFHGVMKSGGSKADAVSAGRSAQRRNRKTFAEVLVGPGKNPQATLQEFGVSPHYQPKRGMQHPGHRAQPFMRPAWDANKRKALEIFGSELRAQIDKAAARAARKAARLRGKSK